MSITLKGEQGLLLINSPKKRRKNSEEDNPVQFSRFADPPFGGEEGTWLSPQRGAPRPEERRGESERLATCEREWASERKKKEEGRLKATLNNNMV